MKHIKKVLSYMLVLSMIFTCMPQMAYADEGDNTEAVVTEEALAETAEADVTTEDDVDLPETSSEEMVTEEETEAEEETETLFCETCCMFSITI